MNNNPTFTVICLDTSHSMGSNDYAPSRLTGAVLATAEMLRSKNDNGLNEDKVAIITFNHKANLAVTPCSISNRDKIFTALETIDASGTTNFNKALELARDVFNQNMNELRLPILAMLKDALWGSQSTTRHDFTPQLIFLSDGEHLTNSDPRLIAKDLKNMGVDIHCVGIAGDRKDVDETLLKDMASIPDQYRFIKDTQELKKEFKRLGTLQLID